MTTKRKNWMVCVLAAVFLVASLYYRVVVIRAPLQGLYATL